MDSSAIRLGQLRMAVQEMSDLLANQKSTETLNTLTALWDTVLKLDAQEQALTAQAAERRAELERVSGEVAQAEGQLREAIAYMGGQVAADAGFNDFPQAIRSIRVPVLCLSKLMLEEIAYLQSAKIKHDPIIMTRALAQKNIGKVDILVAKKDGTSLTDAEKEEIVNWARRHVYYAKDVASEIALEETGGCGVYFTVLDAESGGAA